MKEFSKFYDKYGDSYYEFVDEKALKDICDTIKLNDTINNEDLMELEDDLLYTLPKLWIFS